jgi:hypothetical protein
VCTLFVICSAYFGDDTHQLLPACSDNMSDSGNFDSVSASHSFDAHYNTANASVEPALCSCGHKHALLADQALQCSLV